MNILTRYLLVFSLFSVISMPIYSYSYSNWDEFLINPTDKSFIEIKNFILSISDSCGQIISTTQAQRNQLIKYTQEGNRFAFNAALLVFHCWDGGELGDFYRSSGIFFESNPYAFMDIVKNESIADMQFKDMLTMLPLNTVDNVKLKLTTLENRINIMTYVDDESFGELRGKGLMFLNEEKNNIKIHSLPPPQ